MSDEGEYEYFKLRKQAKAYITKVFTFNAWNTERVRQVRMVIEGKRQKSNSREIEGSNVSSSYGGCAKNAGFCPCHPRRQKD